MMAADIHTSGTMSSDNSLSPCFPIHVMLGVCALCVLAYLPGLGGDFLFDDFPNLVNNAAIHAAAQGSPDWLSIAFLTGSGPLRRPISMLSFGLNAYWFGMSPFAFKLVNLAIHLLNGLLLFGVLRRITPRLLPASHPPTALLAALATTAIWLLHPLQVSSVLYVVQRMNLLATLFTLVGLWCYVGGRGRMLAGRPGLAIALGGVCFAGVLATLCKENGVLIVLYAFVLEWLVFRFAGVPRDAKSLRAFFWLTAALPCIVFSIYLLRHPEMLEYSRNGFTLYTRLLSEARVLCEYLLWTFLPLPSFMGIYHDDIPVSAGLLSPPTTIVSILFLVMLAVLAWRLRVRKPVLALAVAWFLAGHTLESTIFPLELVFEHRNYLPMAGPLLAAVVVVAARPWQLPHRLGIAIASAVVAVLAATTAVRANDWGSALSLALADVVHHPRSARAHYEAGRAITIDGARRGALEAVRPQALVHMVTAARLDPLQVYPATASILLRGKTQTTPTAEVADLARRLRSTDSNEQANPFLDLLVSASNAELMLAPADVALLFEAALQNPVWRPQTRAMMYNNYGAYRFNIEGKHEAGMQLTRTAAELDTHNAYFELNLAKMALALGDRQAANAYLSAARNRDRLGTQRTEIDMLQRQLDD